MFLSCENKVESLKRIEFGQIKLDPTLDFGQYRSLTNEELILLIK